MLTDKLMKKYGIKQPTIFRGGDPDDGFNEDFDIPDDFYEDSDICDGCGEERASCKCDEIYGLLVDPDDITPLDDIDEQLRCGHCGKPNEVCTCYCDQCGQLVENCVCQSGTPDVAPVEHDETGRAVLNDRQRCAVLGLNYEAYMKAHENSEQNTPDIDSDFGTPPEKVNSILAAVHDKGVMLDG
jgi:hypothetical protein